MRGLPPFEAPGQGERLVPLDLAERSFRKPEKASRSFAAWIVFGERPESVDIADGEGDVLLHVPRDRAAAVLEARSDFLDRLRETLCAGDEP